MKLTKKQRKQIDEFNARYSAAIATLEEKQSEANTAIVAAHASVVEAVQALNSLVEEANEFRQEIEADIQAFLDDKTDRWLESDRGVSYGDWLSLWQTDLPTIEEPDCNELDVVGDAADELFGDDFPLEPAA